MSINLSRVLVLTLFCLAMVWLGSWLLGWHFVRGLGVFLIVWAADLWTLNWSYDEEDCIDE